MNINTLQCPAGNGQATRNLNVTISSPEWRIFLFLQFYALFEQITATIDQKTQ